MKVTVLVENTTSSELACEHGLSFLIHYQDKNILLDAGTTEAFYENAKCLNIELGKVDFGVLSHGHYDHSGGLEAFFHQNQEAKVYAQEGVVNPYYSGSGGIHEIGVPKNVLSYRDRFVFIKGSLEIEQGIWLIPHHTAGLEKIGEKTKLYREQEGELRPDDFAHEQSLVLETEKGLVIFNSCSHGGMANIIREVKEVCGQQKLYAYIGGLHMKGKANGEEICTFSEKEIEELCEVIRTEQIAYVYTGHCTGLPGLQHLQARLGDRIKALTTGLQFEV